MGHKPGTMFGPKPKVKTKGCMGRELAEFTDEQWETLKKTGRFPGELIPEVKPESIPESIPCKRCAEKDQKIAQLSDDLGRSERRHEKTILEDQAAIDSLKDVIIEGLLRRD